MGKVCFFKKVLVLNPYPQTPFPRKGAILLGITCFAEEIGASTVVGASSGNTNTGVQFDTTIYIVCGVALAVVIAVGIITAVLSKKKKNK